MIETSTPSGAPPPWPSSPVGSGLSVAGPDGGYELAGAPGGEVIEASEGPVRSNKCVLRGGPCRLDGTCAVHDAWFDAQAALAAKLASTSFEDLRAAMGAVPPRRPADGLVTEAGRAGSKDAA